MYWKSRGAELKNKIFINLNDFVWFQMFRLELISSHLTTISCAICRQKTPIKFKCQKLRQSNWKHIFVYRKFITFRKVSSVQLKRSLLNSINERQKRIEDKMEESTNDQNPSRASVSETLIQSLQGLFEKISVSKIETVFKVIKRNLTYENPGMFNETILTNERERQIQQTTVMWIINQVLYVSTLPQFER